MVDCNDGHGCLRRSRWLEKRHEESCQVHIRIRLYRGFAQACQGINEDQASLVGLSAGG